MDTIFMNSKNSKTFKPPVLIFKFSDKIDLRTLLYQIFVFITNGKT